VPPDPTALKGVPSEPFALTGATWRAVTTDRLVMNAPFESVSWNLIGMVRPNP